MQLRTLIPAVHDDWTQGVIVFRFTYQESLQWKVDRVRREETESLETVQTTAVLLHCLWDVGTSYVSVNCKMYDCGFHGSFMYFAFIWNFYSKGWLVAVNSKPRNYNSDS